ncbi:MAG: FAD-binding oxidoreductase [Rhizobacter sp.]|nr:FAD-binding oxidoreductase [Chlorobiales bacterium]
MILKTDTSEVQSFLEDASTLRDGHTQGVYFPETYEEVAELLKDCSERGVRLTISGNGTGTTGGRIPYGDFILATNKFNRILSIQKNPDGTGLATAQCGVLLYDVQQEVESQGLLYPPDPTERYCFIGATISNNSSGARTFKYGPTRSFIERLKVALTTGDILDIPRGTFFADAGGRFDVALPSGTHLCFKIPSYRMPDTKHMAGYFAKPEMDLIDLFIGAEGTLGVVLEADLRLLAKPEKIFSVVAYFDDREKVLSFVDAARWQSQDNLKSQHEGVSARALEYFDQHALDFLRQKHRTIPDSAVGAIFFEQEVTSGNEDRLLALWYELMEQRGALMEQSWFAQTPDEQQKLRDFRHDLPVLVNELLARTQQRKISTDMAVPHAKFRELLETYDNGCTAGGFHYIIFGHIGNAHLHLNILPRNNEEFLRAKELYKTFITKAIELGGTISAEHGVGKTKSEYLAEMFGSEGIAEMIRIKKVFDPNLVLGIGNLIPEKFLKADAHAAI